MLRGLGLECTSWHHLPFTPATAGFLQWHLAPPGPQGASENPAKVDNITCEGLYMPHSAEHGPLTEIQGPGVQTLDRPPHLAVSGQDNYICSSKLPCRKCRTEIRSGPSPMLPGLQAWELAKACSMHSYPLSVAPGRTTQTPELRMPLNFKWAGREQRKRRRGRQRPASGCKDWSLDNLMHPSICLGLWRHLLTVPSGTREVRKQ